MGDSNKGNAGDGIHVEGNSNNLLADQVFASLGDGFDITGNSKLIQNCVAGDKSKGNLGDGFVISGKSNTLDGNTANANGAVGNTNTGRGFYIKGSASTGNKLKNNKSNTTSSGGTNENASFEYKFEAAITDQGGNKKDNANFTSIAIGTYE